MRKKYTLWLLTLLSTTSYIDMIASEELNESSSNKLPATQVNSFVLPPIRRIGLDVVETNVDEFRNFMRKQDRLLHGVVALPYNDQDIRRTLAQDLEQQTKNTGRFWNLSFTQFLNILSVKTQSSSQKDLNNKITNLKHKLELDYNLDAWLKPKVYFAPDQTLVRLSLNGAGLSTSSWAREDILLEAQASEDKIISAFAEALSRIIATIGHDGRVTYTRDNLMTIDFGSERGLMRGQKITAGYVMLTSFHPQSGEFLRAQRLPLYELKVLEARQGSSLCQITAVDKMKVEQVAKMLNSTLVMLAWRPEKIESKIGWREPYDPQTAPLLGAAESGFGIPLEKKVSQPIADKRMETLEIKKAIVSPQPPPQKERLSPEQEGMGTSTQNTENFTNRLYFQKSAYWRAPHSWSLIQLKTGGGISLGSFAEGEASAFPTTLLNRLESSAFLHIDSARDLYAEPYLQYAFYNGSNVSGSSYFLGTHILNAAWTDSSQGQNIYFGGGIEITGGTIKNNRSSTNLANVGVLPVAKWKSNLNGFGQYDIEASFSIFDLIQSYPVWTLRSEFQPFELMPKQTVFNMGLKRNKYDWIEFTIGVSWDFAQNN